MLNYLCTEWHIKSTGFNYKTGERRRIVRIKTYADPKLESRNNDRRK